MEAEKDDKMANQNIKKKDNLFLSLAKRRERQIMPI
jgi:hypothetical protein